MNLDKLVKLLNLSTSDSDGEALSAIRMANKLIKAEGKSWEEVLNHPGPKSSSGFDFEKHYEPVFFVKTKKGNYWNPQHRATLFRSGEGWKFVIDGKFPNHTFHHPDQAFEWYKKHYKIYNT